MPAQKYVQNQVFVGLPWKNVKQRYEKVIAKLKGKYPVHFTIVGRNDGHTAQNLFDLIKSRIENSSSCIFDATGGNANVSLEYGYAEGVGVQRSIFINAHKSANKATGSSPIISDLSGQRRCQYKNERALFDLLVKFTKEHAYTKRFETALGKIQDSKSKMDRARRRKLALEIVHALDDKVSIRRESLTQELQAKGFTSNDIEFMLSKLSARTLINCTVGRYSNVSIT